MSEVGGCELAVNVVSAAVVILYWITNRTFV